MNCFAPGALLAMAVAVDAVASSGGWRFQPYVHCDGFAGGVRGVVLERRPPNARPWRNVELGREAERVSVLDGYRVTYSHPRKLPFANLKVERSDPVRYEEDKRIVTRNFGAIAKGDGNVKLVSFSERGFSGQTLTKNELAGRALGITQIFVDEDAVIVTIFFLNQLPENRRFQTYEEFVLLRDSFVSGYLECVARKKAVSPPS
jgi:hypothetical protein